MFWDDTSGGEIIKSSYSIKDTFNRIDLKVIKESPREELTVDVTKVSSSSHFIRLNTIILFKKVTRVKKDKDLERVSHFSYLPDSPRYSQVISR